MNLVIEAAHEIQQFIQAHRWQFCIIGGLAVVRWGRPRSTQDVDISLLSEFGSEASYVHKLLEKFSGRISDAAEFAISNRVLLATASNGVALDIALAGFPYEEQVISRATAFEFSPGVALITASAEDLLVLKSFAARDQDWSDVEGILVRQSGEIDLDYVFHELRMLCELKDDFEPVARLRQQAERLLE